MALVVIEPAAAVLSLEECKAHCRVLTDIENDLINGLARVAEQHIGGPDGWLGRSLGLQKLELRLDCWPGCDPISLPCPPVTGIVSVKYVGDDGTEQMAAANTYRLIGDPAAKPLLAPAYRLSWPSVRCDSEAIRITYTAGYETVPAPIRHAMLLLVGHLYENREAVTETAMAELPMAVDALLAPYRIWSI